MSFPPERKAASTTAAVADTACMAGSVRSSSEPSNGIAATDKTSLPYMFSIFQRRAEPSANNLPDRDPRMYSLSASRVAAGDSAYLVILHHRWRTLRISHRFGKCRSTLLRRQIVCSKGE